MPKQITPIHREPPPGKPGGLGEKIEKTVQRVLADLFNSVKDLLVDILSAGFELFLEVLEQTMAKAARPVIDDILKTPGLPPSVRNYLAELRNPTMQGSAIGLGGMVGGLGMNAASSMFAPIFRIINYTVDIGLHTARADPALAWVLSWRSLNVAEKCYTGMRELGWSDDLIDAFREAARPRVSELDLYRAALRGITDDAHVREELHKRGWTAEDRDIIEQLMLQIPGPQDLVTMAVREAFSPDSIRELGLGAEFPSEFAEWMEKQGFEREWALRYWYAHWALPSLSAGYEMLHRGVMDESQLKALLKAQDVSPVWRDRLIEISYSPLTRVDVRRMYGLGVLDRAQVKRAYMDLGYNEQRAEWLTQFTERYETDDAREATKSDILGGFREGMLSYDEAVDWLQQLNYSSEYARYFVDKEVAALARKRQDAQTSSIKTLYVNHDISEPEARTRLTSIGLASGEIDAKISDWRIEREAKTKRPSQATLDTLLKRDTITESEYRTQMSFLGFQDQYLDWYLTLVLEEKAEAARKEEEAARTEQEQIRTRKVKSDYQVAKANLDVDLAELATQIAEVQVAMRERQIRYEKELTIVRKALTAVQLEAEAARDVDALQKQIDDARDAISFLREQIDASETAIAESDLAQAQYEREFIAIRAEAAEEIRRVEAEVATLQVDLDAARDSISTLREEIDAHQTRIAENRLEEAQYAESVADLIRAEPTEEELARIKSEAADRKLAFEIERRELGVSIEQAQDEIAALNTAVLDLQQEIALRRSALEAVTTLDVSHFETERRELRLTIEVAQDDLAELNTSILDVQQEIAARRIQLRSELDIVARLKSETELTAAFNADMASMQERLDGVRINVAQLKEQKAQLEVGYRAGLA